MATPRVCVLQADGINCDEELFYAFEKYKAKPEFVHINQLRAKDKKLKDFQIFAIPGGFCYGDDVASGKILAIELVNFLTDQLTDFVNKKGFIIGVCNGFQVLIRTGLLPFNNLGKMDATLAQNESGHFECRWIKIKSQKSACQFIGEGTVAEVAVNHGEGKFYAQQKMLDKLEKNNLVVFRYVDQFGKNTMEYPQNPNGSTNAIAGVCDPTGHILGLMPHPEKFVDVTQNPNWRRNKDKKPQGSFIIKNMVEYAQES